MKVLSVLLLLATARLLSRAGVTDAIRGTWVVQGYRFAGISALSEKEAKSWIGKTMVMGEKCISLAGVTNSLPRFLYTVHNADNYFIEGFRVSPSSVGYKNSQVREYQIMRTDGTAWQEPGDLFVIVSDTEALTCWDGVFFVLKRSSASERKEVFTGENLNQPFTVHGRLRVYNGSANLRIWIIGSTRMLYV